MIRFDEYRNLDGCGLADLVQRGEVTPQELLECAIARSQQINPAINAIVVPLFSNARRYLKRHQPQGRFAGVPTVLKDLLGDFAGAPTSNGSQAWRYCIAQRHSTLVERLCAQGLVVIGKTNTPELGLLATTENRAFGATRNPWNLNRTAGGSSGGTAAAVAAGIVPFGSAGDGGGSIRIPSACCGLFGLKPSRGLVPAGPEYAEVWDGATVEHMITRSVRDSAALLDVLAGNDSASHVAQFTPPSGFLQALDQPLPKLRIGFTLDSPLGGTVAEECRDAVRNVAELLQSLGHEVEEAPAIEIDSYALVKAYSDIYLAHVGADVRQLEQRFGCRYARASVEPATGFIANLGRRFSAGAYLLSRHYWVQLRQKMAEFHQRYNVWLTPMLAAEPYRLGELRSSVLEEFAMNLLNFSGLHRLVPLSQYYRITALQLQKVPFTQIANLTGQPAMSVPLVWSRNGLPVGVQMVGPVGADQRLLQLARQLEQARPWFNRVPPL
ncbi:MAG TPA: amidase [Dongiaceae bacterium]|nr:amidase [Dongiaceae bacterium]